MIARLGRRPHYPSPVGKDGVWHYVELEREIEFEDHKTIMIWRGWVNSRKLGSGHFHAWLTDELLQKMRGAARVQRDVRKRDGDPSAKHTLEIVDALCSVLQFFSVGRYPMAVAAAEHFRKRA